MGALAVGEWRMVGAVRRATSSPPHSCIPGNSSTKNTNTNHDSNDTSTTNNTTNTNLP